MRNSYYSYTDDWILFNDGYTINTFRHISNSVRIYYAKRSQPPMIIPMMKSNVDSTDDMQFLIENISELENELEYWINIHNVKIEKNGKKYTLAVYKDL